jgi:hypothetical protein
VASAASDAPEAPGPLAALRRLGIFYDLLYPMLVGVGLVALREARTPARRVLAAVVLGGLTLLALRFIAPALFRDAKEIEMLAPAVAVASAAAIAWLLGRGRAGQWTALACLGWAVVLGLTKAASAYAERFVAVGR